MKISAFLSSRLTRCSAAALALMAAVALAPTAVQGQMAVKPGLWENTMTMTMAGMPQMSPEQMEKMKAAGIKMPFMGGETKAKSCVTKEEIEKFGAPKPETQRQSGCEMQNFSRTASGYTGHMVCTGNMAATADFTVTILDPNHITSTMKMDGTMKNGKPVHMQMDSSGSFLSPDCGSIKPGSPEIE
jgi:Protein of unknown function (DUF3617)